MAKKHKVTIWCEDNVWLVKCSACSCTMNDFGAPGLAEQAADIYHSAHGTKIDSIKVK